MDDSRALKKMSSIVENPIEVVSSALELQRIDESEMEDVLGNTALPHSKLKHLDTQDSLASNDSDISLSFDNGTKQSEEIVPEDDHMADNDTSDSDGHSSNGKDSGCEVAQDVIADKTENVDKPEDEPPFVPPDEELANRIVAQVEFYFSDVNITKDAFLLKHVKRNKEGYVSLKLISSFKRVKHLAKDWRVVAYALERSTKLEINEARTKLRRVDALPPYDQTTPSRTIVAINLPMEKPTIESVAELFRSCGEIALIRILRPGNPIPADVRSFANKHPEMNGCVSALVEFDRTESAKMAIERQDADWRTGIKCMKVVELNAPPSTDRKKRTQAKKSNLKLEGEFSSSCQSSSEAEIESRYRQRRSSSPHPTRAADIPRLQRRFSNRDSGSDSGCREQYRPPCACCNHCGERRYSSSGSGYDSPIPGSYRRFSITREPQENGYPIPGTRRYSGAESPCCMSLRRHSRESGSDSSTSFGRPHDLARRFSRDSMSGSESGLHRRFSRDSVSSETGNNFRRFSRESVGSDVFMPPFLSRSSSRDIMDQSRRSSFGSNSGCEHHAVAYSSASRSSFSVPPCGTSCPPHMPENVVRLPKGPDGSKGFGTAP